MGYAGQGGLVAAVVFFLTACGTWGPGDLPSDRLERPIYYGTPDSNPAVVAITNGPGTGYFCSGTLITPNVVLTAAHCLDGANTSSIQIMFGDSVGSGTYVQTTEALMHPSYDAWSITNDIALIRLSGSAPANVIPIPALPPGLALTAADEGGSIEISGFGQTETQSSGDKLHVNVTLSKVCPGPNGCSFGSGWAEPKTIGYPRSPGGTCYGDSGGPAFLVRGGQQYVVGVTSYGDQGCTIWGVSTKVDDFASFISDFTGGVVPEICATPGDEDGDGLADCADPDCALHPDCLGPDACVQAQAVGCGAQISGDTATGTSQFLEYSCLSTSPEPGPERAFELTAPAGTTVTASLTLGGSGDLDLFLVPADGGLGCAPEACLQGSYNSGTSPENLTFTMPAQGAFLVVETWDTASPFTLSLTCSGNTPTPDENCTNMNDDDGDGAVDCQDTDCTAHPACVDDPDPDPDPNPDPDPSGGELCDNGMDDDGDLIVDCHDPDCAVHPSCQSPQAGVTPVVGGQACNQGGSAPSPMPWLGLVLALVWLGFGRKRR